MVIRRARSDDAARIAAYPIFFPPRNNPMNKTLLCTAIVALTLAACDNRPATPVVVTPAPAPTPPQIVVTTPSTAPADAAAASQAAGAAQNAAKDASKDAMAAKDAANTATDAAKDAKK